MKRFTETQKWEDTWFRKQPLEMKALWCWLLDKCDNAGVIDPDIELASFQIGYEYPMDTLSRFGSRVVKISGDKWFIPKFIEFQVGTLSPDCKAHNPIFASLRKHGLEGYPMGIHTPQEKEKEKEEDKEKEKDSSARGESTGPDVVEPPVDHSVTLAKAIWDAYPKAGRERSSQQTLLAELKKIPKKDLPTIEAVSQSLAAWRLSRKFTDDDGKWIQGVHIWAKQRQWENTPEPASKHAVPESELADPGHRKGTVVKLSELTRLRKEREAFEARSKQPESEPYVS